MNPLVERIHNMTPEQMEAASKHVMLGGGTRGGPVLCRGKGVHVWDSEGTEYIDCTSQSWALYLGYADDEINEVVADHMKYLSHIHQGFDNKPRAFLAQRLAELAPGDLNRVSFTVGGGPAVEAAMKIAIKNTQPSRDFICLWDAYHGTTIGSMGASWISTKANGRYMGGTNFLALTRPFIRIPNPFPYRNAFGMEPEAYVDMCITMARETMQRGIAGKPAGVIVEPIQASGGQIILPKRYLQALRDLCDEYETVLIYDEIQTFGRIGEFFAADYFGVTPDIIVLGKALGGGLPLAAIIVSDKLEGFSPDTEELHTFANPTASMVASAKLLERLEGGVLENSRTMGAYLKEGIEKLMATYPQIGEVRQAGMHIGVDFVKDPSTREAAPETGKAVRKAGFEHGLIMGLGGVRRNVLKVKPPMIINQDECDEVLSRLEKSIADVLG
jgi:4-aminobutyrate aminotransferase-like enzyme